MDFFAKGFLLGILTSLPTGPVGFLIIRRLLVHGLRAGKYSVLGSVSGDTFYTTVVGFSITIISSFLITYQHFFQFIGGVFLAFLGFRILGEYKKKQHHEQQVLLEKNPLHDFFSTFFMTLTNPTLIVSFSIMFTAVGLHTAHSISHIIACLLGVLIGSIVFWVAIGLWFKIIRDRSNQKTLQMIDYTSGVVITISGIVLFIVAVVGFFLGKHLI